MQISKELLFFFLIIIIIKDILKSFRICYL